MGKDGKPAAAGKVVTDSRFAAVHHDPRFQRFPRAKAKVEIDERFAGGWAPPAVTRRLWPRWETVRLCCCPQPSSQQCWLTPQLDGPGT